VATVLKRFNVGPMQNFCYMIGDEKTKQALVLDPAWAPDTITGMVEKNGFKLSGLIVSHAHYDHTNAIEILLQKFDVPVYAQKEEVEYAKTGNAIVGDLGDTAKKMNDGDVITLGETTLRLIHTPGHTPGSQCIEVANTLLTGDTLFIGGCGRSDLPGGNPELLFKSLGKIAKLRPDVRVCPGHDYGEVPERTLGEELKLNPYLRMNDESQFLEAMG
jgi:glyoxylase-like metal-dependent hydrolase (beta-lactamase superfamily II)